MVLIPVYLTALLAASPVSAQVPNIDWDGNAMRSLTSGLSLSRARPVVNATPSPSGRRDLPESPRRHYRQISGPGGGTLLEPAPLYDETGRRAMYQPNMSVGVVRQGNVIEWYPVKYGYYADSEGRLVKGQHVTFNRHGGTYFSVPWADLPLPLIGGTYLVPNGVGVHPYGVGDNPVFHPYVGTVPLKREERTGKEAPPPVLPKRRRNRDVQYGF